MVQSMAWLNLSLGSAQESGAVAARRRGWYSTVSNFNACVGVASRSPIPLTNILPLVIEGSSSNLAQHVVLVRDAETRDKMAQAMQVGREA